MQKNPKSRDFDPGSSTVTGVFISRLDPKTTEYQVRQLIKRETGLHLRAAKLDTRFDTYSSFHVRGDKKVQDTLMCAELWPKGTLVKLFYEKF